MQPAQLTTLPHIAAHPLCRVMIVADGLSLCVAWFMLSTLPSATTGHKWYNTPLSSPQSTCCNLPLCEQQLQGLVDHLRRSLVWGRSRAVAGSRCLHCPPCATRPAPASQWGSRGQRGSGRGVRTTGWRPGCVGAWWRARYTVDGHLHLLHGHGHRAAAEAGAAAA